MSCIAIKKFCKVHGQLTVLNSIIRIDRRYSKNSIVIECRDCSKESDKEYYKKNKEKRNKYNIEWTRNNKEKLKIIRDKTRQKYRIKQNEARKLRYVDHKKTLSDQYVKTILSRCGGLKFKDVPKELIEVKRLTLAIKRLIKEKENG